MMQWGVYISEEGALNARKYKYSGGDNSLVYRFFCSPLAEACVKRFVPLWVAPNLITCLGLLPSLLGHALIWYHCNDLRSSCPRWCWAVLSVCTFVYQTLDNMDGKQARRTGTSSPLGLLIDHSCDALNIVLSSLNIMAMFQLSGSPRDCLLVWLGSTTPFFFATWEEFHTGTLYLGPFNGPTDGVLLLCAAQMVSACVEDYSTFWSAESILGWGWSRKACVIGFYLICVFGTVNANFVAVFKVTRSWPNFGRAVGQTVPFVATLVLAGVWLLCTAMGARLFDAWPRPVFWTVGSIFLQLVFHLQMAHICGEKYQPLRRSILFQAFVLTALTVASVVGGTRGEAYERELRTFEPVEVPTLFGCVALMVLYCHNLVVGAMQEMASILGVRIFSIPPPPSKLS
mmetsp:Transcript_93213/g.237107  ORF Transcript_93213/g.237107 Transcript_93213/m.237107 type:complete len:401 (-) Transcript_93213:43-1245(-)